MNISLSVIIIEHKDFSLLKTCLRSVVGASAGVSTEVLVVCNIPSEKTINFLSRKYPRVKVIKNEQRKGFAENCSAGARAGRGKYILILNPDTILMPKSLKRWINFMETHPLVGICGPQLINLDGSLQYSCRRFPTWKSFFVRRTPLRLLMSNARENYLHLMKDIDHNKTQEVDWILGGCMMIRKKMMGAIGDMDKHFFLYVEDIDYCLRSWKHGWKVMYYPKIKVVHEHKAKSDARLLSIYSLYHIKSMLYFIYKHGVKPTR